MFYKMDIMRGSREPWYEDKLLRKDFGSPLR